MPKGDISLFYTFHFYLFGLVAIVSALLFVTRKSPVAAALWLVNTMFCLAALYVLLDAQFIGAIQVISYAVFCLKKKTRQYIVRPKGRHHGWGCCPTIRSSSSRTVCHA